MFFQKIQFSEKQESQWENKASASSSSREMEQKSCSCFFRKNYLVKSKRLSELDKKVVQNQALRTQVWARQKSCSKSSSQNTSLKNELDKKVVQNQAHRTQLLNLNTF